MHVYFLNDLFLALDVLSNGRNGTREVVPDIPWAGVVGIHFHGRDGEELLIFQQRAGSLPQALIRMRNVCLKNFMECQSMELMDLAMSTLRGTTTQKYDLYS